MGHPIAGWKTKLQTLSLNEYIDITFTENDLVVYESLYDGKNEHTLIIVYASIFEDMITLFIRLQYFY